MNPTVPATADAATYSAVLTLRDGRKAEIRALRPTDRKDLSPLLAIPAIARFTAASSPRGAALPTWKSLHSSMSISSITWHWSP